MPQLRSLDGQDVTHFEKVKADILFGADLENKKEIFKNFLPDEQFVDRRLFVAEQIDPESDSEEEEMEKMDNYESGRKIKTNTLLSTRNYLTLSSINDKKIQYVIYYYFIILFFFIFFYFSITFFYLLYFSNDINEETGSANFMDNKMAISAPLNNNDNRL